MPRHDSVSPSRHSRRGDAAAATDDRHAASSSRHREDRRSRKSEERDDRRRHHRDDSDRRHRDRDHGSDHRHDRDSDRPRDDHRRHRSRSHDSDDRRHKRRHRESSTERAERKAAKRAAKAQATEDEQKRRAAAAEMLMYSVEDNPFHDANLDQKFKWGKKEDKERKMGLTPQEAARRDAERRREAQEEIAKLNAKRAQREKEQAEREEDEARMARLAESAAMSEWVAKEDDFHLEQSKRRAAIRIKEQRAKPIDLLAMNLKWADPQILEDKRDADEDDYAGLEIDFDEPYNIFESLDLAETEELHQDIQMYLTLEKNEQNLGFWRSMIVVCDDKLSELRSDSGSRLDPTVKAEMNAMLATKSHDELLKLQEQVQAKLASGEPVDVEYWESLLKSILVWRAKAKLRDMHEVVLSNRLEFLRRHQRDEAVLAANVEGASYDDDVDAERQAESDRATGMAAFLRAQRSKVGRSVEEKEEAMLREEMAKGLEDVEAAFKEEVELGGPSKVYDWDDKYRPRKPRYFNRVISGFEWNKYNQSHYDKSNPPPKVVQGYRFNIFYPDLVDKTTTPRYDIIREPGNDETVILKFSAGPPYEDLAFRIINGTWAMSNKRGFKSTFDRGVLTLHFSYTRSFYRR